MRRIGLLFAAFASVGCAVAGVFVVWRRNPRVGSRLVNSVVNPRLLQHGLAGGRTSEIGTIEHVGRISGIRRLTPVHPEATSDGFRIIVPLGPQSQWARNVLTAGHCRLQLHDIVYDLDEPALVPANDVDALPTAVRRGMAALGFEYLTLRTFDSEPGSLEPGDAAAPVLEGPRPGTRWTRVEEPSPALAGSPSGA